jgi:hypothetical protein
MVHTSMFQVQPAFTWRTIRYSMTTSRPRFVNMDMTLAKMFPSRSGSARAAPESYNITNSFSGADPNLAVTGGTIFDASGAEGRIYGRQFQYSGRFIW